MTEQAYVGGLSALALGVCYYPEHWPEQDWAQDAAQMRALGLRCVRIGEFAWSRIEPKRNHFDFDWLDRAIATLAAENLRVVLCTPTATPPKWLVDEYPDILPWDVSTGQVRGYGSRRHYDFSSDKYREEALRISTVLAERYGHDERIVGWQIDNELCCHDTAHSRSPAAHQAFQRWCQQRYETIDQLNIAWGNVFWSMEYPSFSAIELPFGTVTEPNPAHQIAYRRFASDQILRFQQDCCSTIRCHSTNQWITHNFIPMKDTQTDCFALAAPLDFVSYDSYPLGRTEFLLGRNEPELARRYMRTGHPDYTAFYLDQCRGLKGRGFWIMEQQPGPVNWAPSNPRPAPGMVALWTLEAIAHGADVVSFFRWRQAAFAQEQMHAGLLRSDRSHSDAWQEVETVIQLLTQLASEPLPQPTARVALVTDVSAQWVYDIERQGQDVDAPGVTFQFYRALRRLNMAVDIVSESSDLSPYALVVVAAMPIVSIKLLEACERSEATFLFGPRSGAKTEEFQIPSNRAPGVLQSWLELQVNSVETLRPDVQEPFYYADELFHSRLWCEDVTVGSASIEAVYQGHRPALVRKGRFLYFATLTDDAFLRRLLGDLLTEQGLQIHCQPEDVRMMSRGAVTFAFNYGSTAHTLAIDGHPRFLAGSQALPAQGFSLWRND